jgi:hypothetical protein
MRTNLAAIGSAIARRWVLWTAAAIGYVVFYNLILLAALMARFGELPNYATLYDYPGNVIRILAGTPSLADAVQIIGDEWLLEVGHMNYQYGNGISEWSLTVLPAKLAVLLAVGALLATVIVLVFPGKDGTCAVTAKSGAIGAAGGGAALVGFSNATLSWVVCCAAPNWVASLAMLGMSVSWAFWLEPFGHAITATGFGALVAAIVVLANRRKSPESITRVAGRASAGGGAAVVSSR